MRLQFAPNRKAWSKGDLVIGDRDAKERKMIRVVVAKMTDGTLRTVFQFKKLLPPHVRDRVMYDDPRRLHDPRRFGLSISKKKKAA